MADLLAKSVRIAFRNMCSEIYLGAIQDMFESEGFSPDNEHVPGVSGQRRTLVEQYHATIRWDDYGQVTRVLRVYSRGLRGQGHPLFGDERWTESAMRLIAELTEQGFRVDDNGTISYPPGMLDGGVSLDEYAVLSDPEHVQRRIGRMESAIVSDPDAAIGSAKEFMESVCKMILEDGGKLPARNLDISALYKQTARHLALDTDSVPESTRGSAAAHQVLRSLATAVQGMSELRNAIGTGHGQARQSPAQPRHARLAVGSAKTLGFFLLDTWQSRRSGA